MIYEHEDVIFCVSFTNTLILRQALIMVIYTICAVSVHGLSSGGYSDAFTLENTKSSNLVTPCVDDSCTLRLGWRVSLVRCHVLKTQFWEITQFKRPGNPKCRIGVIWTRFWAVSKWNFEKEQSFSEGNKGWRDWYSSKLSQLRGYSIWGSIVA